jgi:spore germination protein YaaH
MKITAARYFNTFLVLLLLSGLFLLAAETPLKASAAPNGLPLRWAYYVRQPSSVTSVQQNIQNLDILSPFYFVLDYTGLIGGSNQPEITNLAKSKGVKVIPMLQNSAAQNDFHALITNPLMVQSIIDQIDYLIQAYDYDGIHIDFEDLRPDDRPYLTYFMANLAARLHPKGKLVTMAVAAKFREVTGGWAGVYDYAALAPYLDLVTVMTYDYSYSGSRSGPVAPADWVDLVAAYAATQFGGSKVLLGLPFYGYDWNLSQGGNASAYDYPTILDLVRNNAGTISFDEGSQSPYADYVQNNQYHRAWFENARSLSAKLDIMYRNNLRGWAAWRLGQEGSDYWPVLNSVANPTRPIAELPNSPAQVYFKETGHTLGSLFLKFWQKNGGLNRFGYPWTEEFEEKSALDGKIYIVQYFERARFEYHPELTGPDGPVVLGKIGSEFAAQRQSEPPFQKIAPLPDSADRYYFAETGHSLEGAFKTYWETTGGPKIYGLPISEEFTEVSPLDGQAYIVQYFERDRLEFHPATGEVAPGLLGSQLLSQRGWLTPLKN